VNRERGGKKRPFSAKGRNLRALSMPPLPKGGAKKRKRRHEKYGPTSEQTVLGGKEPLEISRRK